MSATSNWRRAYLDGWEKTFDYKSKSKRLNFWVFFSINIAISWLLRLAGLIIYSSINTLYIYDWTADQNGFFSIWSILLQIIYQALRIFGLFFLLGSILAEISLCVRRLRDLEKNPAWAITMLCCPPLLLFWFTKPSVQSSAKQDDI